MRSKISDDGLRSLQDDAMMMQKRSLWPTVQKDSLKYSLYEEALLRHVRSFPEDALTRPLRSSVQDKSLIRSLQYPANEDINGNGIMRYVGSVHGDALMR